MAGQTVSSTLEIKARADTSAADKLLAVLTQIVEKNKELGVIGGSGASMPGGGGSGVGGASGGGSRRAPITAFDQLAKMVGRETPGRPAVGSRDWFRQTMMGGGDLGKMAGMGLAGHALLSGINNANQAGSAYFNAGVGQEAGMYSGSAFGAASAMSQAAAARTQAKWQGAGGVGSTIGGGLMAGGAAAGFTPVGWGMMAGGAAVSIGSGLGSSYFSAEAGKLSAREQAAIGQMEKSMGGRLSLARMQLVGRYFGADVGDDIGRTANRFGVNVDEAQTRFGQYRRGVGKRGAFGADDVMGLQYSGLDGGGLSKWERGYLPGGGVKGGSDRMQDLEQTLTQAVRAGMDEARFGEYLERAAGYQQQAAERGVNISADALNRITNGLGDANPGLSGMSRIKAAEGMRGFSGGLSGTLTNAMAPQELIQGMMLQRLAAGGGGPGDWAKTLADPSKMARHYSDLMGSVPDMMRQFFGAQITGLDPSAAGLSQWRPGSGNLPNEVNLAGRARDATDSKEGRSLSLSAEAQNASTMRMTLDELGPALSSLLRYVKVAVDVAKAIAPGAIGKANDELAGVPSWVDRGRSEGTRAALMSKL